jgi:phenylacetate-coenzyme A ligase PaaK-like adenylate-forming protein
VLCMIDVNNIFSVGPQNLEEIALTTFQFQYENNGLYRIWCDRLGRAPASVRYVEDIPALPVSFYKSDRVVTTEFESEVIFRSSGTTGTTGSFHHVKDVGMYRESYSRGFRRMYGEPADWCILGLLPSYLERGDSSLVNMVQGLLQQSGHVLGGFFLQDWEELAGRLGKLEADGQKTLLIGVTYALLDFAERHPMELRHTVVMETGGMKGRREELTRSEVHDRLKLAFGLGEVHSEYGMTELLSQAYSKGGGRFVCPPWMRVLVRDERDPLAVMKEGEGVLQVVDLANRYSCSFIATEDVGCVYGDGSFEVWGRQDDADLRGCSLLAV